MLGVRATLRARDVYRLVLGGSLLLVKAAVGKRVAASVMQRTIRVWIVLCIAKIIKDNVTKSRNVATETAPITCDVSVCGMP